MRILLALIALPVIEIALLIKVGEQLGVLGTLALLVLSMIAGIQLLRIQGFSTLLRVQQRLQQGDVPAEDILGSMFLALAGVLFIIPGFFTDILGFLCLLPPVRRRLARRFFAARNTQVHSTIIEGEFYDAGTKPFVIEAQYSREDDNKKS